MNAVGGPPLQRHSVGLDPPRRQRRGELIIDLQARGLRVEAQLETRKGGAGPTDSGMLWIEGVPSRSRP